MLRKTLGVILAIMIALTGCTQYIFPEDWWPPRPNDKPSSGELTPEEIAKGIDFEQLNKDISAELAGNNVPGLLVTASTNRPAGSMAYSNIGARSASEEIYIDVFFEASGYRNSATTLISGGRMILTAIGNSDNSSIVLSTYTAETVEVLETSTTIGNQTVLESVEITITTPSVIKGTVNVSSGSVVFSNLEIETPSSNFGATITVGNIEIPINQVINDITEGYNGLFDGGYGTESNPYEIRTTQQFLNIGDEDFQEMLLEGDNENLFFKLTGDIDLRGHSGYVGTVFSGTLDGNNHTITGSNNISYMFRYYLEQVTFKDFTVVFDDSNITLLVSYPAMVATEYNGANYIVEDETLSITFDNVDYRIPRGNEDYYYPVRDNNFALYLDGTVPQGYAVIDGVISDDVLWTYEAETIEGNRIIHIAKITNCDVVGNFIGGFSNSGAAIFVGGQFFDTTINITDCSFEGTLAGQYTSLLVGNSIYCYPGHPETFPYKCKLTARNVEGGNIVSTSGAGTLYFSNDTNTTAISATNVTGNYEKLQPVDAVLVTNTEENQRINVSLATNIPSAVMYQVKLSLPSLYWYDNGIHGGGETGTTDSNTFTIEYPINEEEAIYIAKPITRLEAEALSDTVDAFKEINWYDSNVSANGLRYVFVNVDGTMFLVIDYSNYSSIVMYSGSGVPENLDGYDYLDFRIVIALDSNNNIVGASKV